MIQPCTAFHPDWLRLRMALWPDTTAAELQEEMTAFLRDPSRFVQWLARDDTGRAVGLVEASLRREFVNGASRSPVAFLEGIYVIPEERRKGHARALVECVRNWARGKGLGELCSDALLENKASLAMHRALGFRETERVVFFAQEL